MYMPYIKFQDSSIRGSWVSQLPKSVTDRQMDRRTDGQTDGQAQTNMPPQLLRSWGHKNGTHLLLGWQGEFSSCQVKKVKVSHSLIAVGAVGVRVPLYLGHSWWKAEPIPLLSLPYPSLIRKRYPFSAGLTERVFQSPHGAAEPRTHAIQWLSAQ